MRMRIRTSLAIASLLLWAGTALAEHGSGLSREPIPLQSEAHAVFSVEDIIDFDSLTAALMAAADRPDTPAGRIWLRLPPRVREELTQRPEGEALDPDVTYDIVRGLNAVIQQTDLYDSTIWDPDSLPASLRADLEAGLDKLPRVDAMARNRELVRLTFPDAIKESRARPFVHRPQTLTLFGDPFLDNGNLHKGFKIPTGAVWQPSLFVYGTLRTAWQYEQTGDRLPPITDVAGPPIDRGEARVEEWVSRADVFFNLAFTPTERVLLQLRPLDHNGNYDGYRWQTPGLEHDDDWYLRGDADVQQLFFEGDFGELFPWIDRDDRGAVDVGFAIGRQNLVLQNGIMLNDSVDAIGLVRNNVLAGKAANIRLTALWGWDALTRGVGPTSRERDSADLFGLFTAIDFPHTSVEFDLAYVNDENTVTYLPDRTFLYEGGDQFNVGLSFIQRIGQVNTAFRFNLSERTSSHDTIHSDSGRLVFIEASLTPHGTLDNLYLTAFYNSEHYQSVARDPSTAGPLGQAGILFAPPGLGYVNAPIENTTDGDGYGGALGYQKFFGTRRQLIVELGGRGDLDGSNQGRFGVMARYQQAFRQHYIWRADTYWVSRERLDDKRGIRTEFVVQF